MDPASLAELIKQTREFLANFGISAGVLGLMALFAWRVWTWFKPHGDQILQAHVGLVETLRIEAPKQTAAMQTMSQSVSQLADSRGREGAALKDLSRAIEAVPECEDRRRIVAAHAERAREALE